MEVMVVSCFEVLFQQLPGDAEEYHENLIHDSWSTGADLNPRPAEQEAEVPTTKSPMFSPYDWGDNIKTNLKKGCGA
jgi:hypothetical protein